MSHMRQPRIDLRKLTQTFLVVLFLPTVTAIAIDLWLDMLPTVTLIVILIVFPLATILINRTALREMDRIIQEVAPPLPDSESEAEGS